MDILKDYKSDSSDSEAHDEIIRNKEFNNKSIENLLTKFEVNSAPLVLYSNEKNEHGFISDNVKELTYNPKYEDLYAPKFGPVNPLDQNKLHKNTLTGYVELTNVNDFQFENQRRTFVSYGYAQDPSENGKEVIGDLDEASQKNNMSVFEKPEKRPAEKRKRVKNNDPSDVEGYLGPWALYEDQLLVAKPNEEQKKEIEQILSKRKRRQRKNEIEEEDSKATLHIPDPFDYAGRSFLHIPQDVGANLRSQEPPEKCFIPKKCIHEYIGHTRGVQKIQLFPVSGHLFLTCSMDSKVKLWEFYKERRCIMTYSGHLQGVRDISFNNSGTQFLSASYDRYIKLWDTETGQMKAKFTTKKVPYCVVFNPDKDKENLFVAGMSDKKIICWDVRSGEIVQEYDRHLGAVNTITFVDNNKRIVTTSDDKSIRAWEWDIPVDFKYIADPTMHSMPYVGLSRNGKYLAFQSMDNQIKIMEPNANFRWKNKKVFRGHMVAGYACGLDFSPDMSYIISGDADGRLMIWDWKTTRLYEKIKAHSQVCMDVKWHPHETSKILTCGWDNVIKLWD